MLLVNKVEPVPLGTKGQFRLVFHKGTAESWTSTFIGLVQDWCYMLSFLGTSHKSSCTIMYVSSNTLEAIRECIAIVQPIYYEDTGQGFASIPCDITPESTYITNMIITGFEYLIYLFLHRQS